jgi:hypothetical protein
MDAYCHHVSGFFAHREEADSTSFLLVAQGIPRDRVQIFDAGMAPPAPTPLAASDETLKDVVVDGAIGAAIGTSLGALAELALVAANVSLFVASPLIAPLVLLGWGASLGGLVGASAGASSDGTGHKDGPFAELVSDAISSGQVVLMVETRTEEETRIARTLIRTSVGEDKDIKVA